MLCLDSEIHCSAFSVTDNEITPVLFSGGKKKVFCFCGIISNLVCGSPLNVKKNKDWETIHHNVDALKKEISGVFFFLFSLFYIFCISPNG